MVITIKQTTDMEKVGSFTKEERDLHKTKEEHQELDIVFQNRKVFIDAKEKDNSRSI